MYCQPTEMRNIKIMLFYSIMISLDTCISVRFYCISLYTYFKNATNSKFNHSYTMFHYSLLIKNCALPCSIIHTKYVACILCIFAFILWLSALPHMHTHTHTNHITTRATKIYAFYFNRLKHVHTYAEHNVINMSPVIFSR